MANLPSFNELLVVNFREESTAVGLVGLADFAGSTFQRMANWSIFERNLEATGGKQINFREESSGISRPSVFMSILHNRAIPLLYPVGHPLELRACKIGQSHY